jgi:catechol 2,3-dioxygenase-like lactoylglutathione lyase family enzyme
MNDPRIQAGFNVGGVRLERPFRIRRLGHFGVNVQDMDKALHFYRELLGFSISDPINLNRDENTSVEKVGVANGYFMRHGTDHHSFVLFPDRAIRARPNRAATPPDVTINQITWQVGTLREVVDGFNWLTGRGQAIYRSGRDNPGSNWHTYPTGPNHHINELYYGIEQVGWDGLSKPKSVHMKRYDKAPDLPHPSEFDEIQRARALKIDLYDGYRDAFESDETFDVGGVLLPRPFKVERIGPVRIFYDDLAKELSFYRDTLGLTVTEEITWRGHRCVFLRANTEHHSMSLYPRALRAELGLSPHTTLMAFGLQLGNFQQLRDAVAFLKSKGVQIKTLPADLFPGMGHSALAIDPDGHAMQLYCYMEQIGWDGRPRPADKRAPIDNDHWPDILDAESDIYNGEVFLGPIG